MLLLDGIILHCNTSIQVNRTYSAIYNILKGTKAIQTVMDIHLYHLKYMYGIYPSLQRRDFSDHTEKLVQSGHLKLISENNIQITSKGEELLNICRKSTAFRYFEGLRFLGVSGPFLERLLLTIQTFTNKQMKSNHFIPVVDKTDISNWVKQYYRKHKKEISVILTGLYDELHRFLEKITEEEASLFVDRLTGYNHYGNSIHQLHNKYNIPLYDVPLTLEGITQRLLSTILQNKVEYPILNEFVTDLHHSSNLTKSARKTYPWYYKGVPAEKIASIRNLKVNTIHDHLVEIALYDPDFNYQMYVNQTERKIILKAIQQTKSYRLKEIKTVIEQDITYFQIRLVMATMGNHH